MALMEWVSAMTTLTVRMGVAAVKSTRQIESMGLVEQVSRDHAAAAASEVPREGVIMVRVQHAASLLMVFMQAFDLTCPVALV
jgi:hypothetical protein